MNTSISATVDNMPFPTQKMEIAARNIEKFLATDSAAPRLIDLLNVNPQIGPTGSGSTDHDYPLLNSSGNALNNMQLIKLLSNVPLPTDIVDNTSHAQCHSMMGLFPEINRAWLTVDSDIYVWTYEDNADLAYYDGVSETIVCVGLVRPKPGVFHNFINYLLILATSVDIVVLGVTFTDCPNSNSNEIQLVPEPVFTLPTDGATINTIVGTSTGRIFLGAKDGNLFEIQYQAECSWFGKRCKKINLSTSTLSFLVPSFLNAALTEEDGIVKISVDNSRHIMYVLTEKGTIELYDLGEKGISFSRITKMSQTTLVNEAMKIVKALDSQNFRPIQDISAVEAHESGNINLIAVSQTGVRFYLSVVGFSNLQPNQRPYTLTLAHVRLPPGYSANITIRPRGVEMSNYRDRNLILVSSLKDKNVLWCLNSDMFPFTSTLMESYTTFSLDGPVLAFAEVRHEQNATLNEGPPLLIRQHMEPPRKFVVLTSNGVQIFLKMRPVDVLRQILADSHGYDSEAIKNFFSVLSSDQACATSLILASLENEENVEIAEYATRAFFLYGGEPKVTANNQTMFSATAFSPNIISTPAPHHYGQNLYAASSPTPISSQLQTTFDANPMFINSSKHNGLYLYLSRILRPVWSRFCISKVYLDGKNATFISSISGEDCVRILNNLSALHNFLLRNTQFSSNATNLNASLNQTSIQDVQTEERQSLDALKMFLFHCCQILGLWRILCEHQFHYLISRLPEQQQNILQSTTFKDLFLHRHEICPTLITTLINSYLNDNASVDSISVKLMDVCPNLYKTDDAALSKANEILKLTRTCKNLDEKEEMLLSALQLCKTVANLFNLGEICKQFTALKAYQAVIELCGHCGKKIDPEKIGESFYDSNQNGTVDEEGFAYYQKRMDIYREILNMLECLYVESRQQTNETSDLIALHQVIRAILDYPDELMHVALYEWMVVKEMANELIKLSHPSLETYLKRTSSHNPENTIVLDLLWKYYESNSNHAAAAKILNCLASKTGSYLTLKERLTYLARAIMCMSSDQVGYAPYLGVFLRDLEDKMEVAKVQEQILDALVNLQGQVANATEAVVALNSGLYDVSQLYENFAEPFKLLECQLAIIDCSGYNDGTLIKNIWHDIIADELKKSTGSGNERVSQILSKIQHLARQYSVTSNCLPLEYIVQELELINGKLKGDKDLVSSHLVNMRFPFEKLLETYSKLISISSENQLWQIVNSDFHLAEAIASLIICFINDSENYNSGEKRKITTMSQDCVAALLSTLYSKPNTENLVNKLRSIQTRLSRI